MGYQIAAMSRHLDRVLLCDWLTEIIIKIPEVYPCIIKTAPRQTGIIIIFHERHTDIIFYRQFKRVLLLLFILFIILII